MIFLGVDGGSTKTEWLLSDENGRVLAHTLTAGCNYAFLGKDGFQKIIHAGVTELEKQCPACRSRMDGAMFSITIYGEIRETLDTIPAIIKSELPSCPDIRIVNDSVAGWSGSLGHKPGINLVSGTGSVAYGRDEHQNGCRAGGWSLFFADEGSSCWVARQLIAAFVKQADGRMPRTQIYEEVKNALQLDNDYFLSGYLQQDVRTHSEKLAAMQLIALSAAKKGDPTALKFYEDAAAELVQMSVAIRSRLHFESDTIPVSCSGGLFKAGAVIQTPMRKLLQENEFTYVVPLYSPVVGAVMLAAEKKLSEDQLSALATCVTAHLHEDRPA